MRYVGCRLRTTVPCAQRGARNGALSVGQAARTQILLPCWAGQQPAPPAPGQERSTRGASSQDLTRGARSGTQRKTWGKPLVPRDPPHSLPPDPLSRPLGHSPAPCWCRLQDPVSPSASSIPCQTRSATFELCLAQLGATWWHPLFKNCCSEPPFQPWPCALIGCSQAPCFDWLRPHHHPCT